MNILKCIVFLLLLTSYSGIAQTSVIDAFYKKYDRKDDEVVKLKIHRWMIGFGKLAIRIAGDNDETTQLALDLVNNIKKGRLLVVKDSTQILKDDILNFIENLKKDSFESLITIVDKRSKINILVRESDHFIRNILFLVQEPDNLVVLSAKTKMTIEELSKTIKAYQDYNEDLNASDD